MLHAKGQKTSAGGFGRWPAQTHGSACARDGANHAPVAVACGSGQEERETEGDGGRQLDIRLERESVRRLRMGRE